MARAGRSVCLLERGPERHPGEYPETLPDASYDVQVDGPDGHLGSHTAMFDFRVNPDLNVLVGCGLGGTSLINANVSLPPDPRVFDDPCWPAALRADRDTLLADGLNHARHMLRPTPYPDDWRTLNKLTAHQLCADVMGQPFSRVPINVRFEDGLNHVGVEQRRCTLCGDCVTGCNEWAKNTTLMNYLPDAWNHGAHIFTHTRVRHVAREGDSWVVYFSTTDGGRERFSDTLLSVAAGVVVVAAGTLGSTEILLRSRQRGLVVSPRLGERFSGNGDVLGFAYNTREPIDGISTGPRRSADEAAIGPTHHQRHRYEECGRCRARARHRGGQSARGGGAVSGDPVWPSPAMPTLQTIDGGIVELARRKWSELQSVVGGAGKGALAHAQTFLIMSHDGSNGRLYLENDRLRVDWPDAGKGPIFDARQRTDRSGDSRARRHFHQEPDVESSPRSRPHHGAPARRLPHGGRCRRRCRQSQRTGVRHSQRRRGA